MDISYSMRNTFPALPIVLLPLMLCPYGSSTPLQEGLSNAGRKVFFPKKPFLETYMKLKSALLAQIVVEGSTFNFV